MEHGQLPWQRMVTPLDDAIKMMKLDWHKLLQFYTLIESIAVPALRLATVIVGPPVIPTNGPHDPRAVTIVNARTSLLTSHRDSSDR